MEHFFIALQPFDTEDGNMSITDGHKSYESFDYPDGWRSVKNGRASDSLENQKSKLLKAVGSDRSLHSGVSGKTKFV